MPYLRFEDDDSSTTGTVGSVLLGAVAGFAVGMLVAQRFGGLSGLADRVRRRRVDEEEAEASAPAVADDFSEYDEEYDELEDEGVPNEGLEERVLEAFRNDPILSERAIDIGALDDGIVELTGWVNASEEAEQAEQSWAELQADLARRSSSGKRIIAEKSGHYIQFDQPDLVIDAIRQVVKATHG